MNDYDSIPLEDRIEVEKEMAERNIDEDGKKQIREQFAVWYWLAVSNPHPLRLWWLLLMLKLEMFYRKCVRCIRNFLKEP